MCGNSSAKKVADLYSITPQLIFYQNITSKFYVNLDYDVNGILNSGAKIHLINRSCRPVIVSKPTKRAKMLISLNSKRVPPSDPKCLSAQYHVPVCRISHSLYLRKRNEMIVISRPMMMCFILDMIKLF